jgi:hypothetical protein
MHTLGFAIAAVALGMPFLVPLMWGQIEKSCLRELKTSHPNTDRA